MRCNLADQIITYFICGVVNKTIIVFVFDVHSANVAIFLDNGNTFFGNVIKTFTKENSCNANAVFGID